MIYRNIRQKYVNGKSEINIGEGLIAPCLSECISYRRGTAFFSSSSLKTYANSLKDIIERDIKIQILCSPIVQDRGLIDILDELSTQESRDRAIQKESENILLVAAGFGVDPNNIDYRSKILSYMIASGQLEIKFAIPKKYENLLIESDYEALYHVKNGYFNFPNGDEVAFDGSFNESKSGHANNRERAQVFRSWVDIDSERLRDTIDDIDEEWEGKSLDLNVYPLSKDIVEKIKKIAPKTTPCKIDIIDKEDGFQLWEHQEEAISKFLEKKVGILEMATGTGKTTTALEIVKRLYESNEIDSIVISTYGNSLLSQWEEEVYDWRANCPDSNNRSCSNLRVYRDFDTAKEMQSYLSSIEKSILIISRDSKKLQALFSNNRIDRLRDKLLVIHDEIHGFGSKSLVENLTGSHDGIKYKLGLSATPERDYDEKGSIFLTNEIGPVIFQFSIEKAIEKKILCEFNYHPINFQYTKNDKKNIKKIYARESTAARQGKPWTKDVLYRELSKVRKKAENKPDLLDEFLSKNRNLVRSSIFFVQDKEQGEKIAKIVSNYTGRFATFYEGKSDKFVNMLSTGKIDALIACERLNEGVDIRSLKNIFLVATPRAKLVTIQRMGRCLRIDPNNKLKTANIIDFILENNNEKDKTPADQYRKEWILKLAK